MLMEARFLPMLLCQTESVTGIPASSLGLILSTSEEDHSANSISFPVTKKFKIKRFVLSLLTSRHVSNSKYLASSSYCLLLSAITHLRQITLLRLGLPNGEHFARFERGPLARRKRYPVPSTPPNCTSVGSSATCGLLGGPVGSLSPSTIRQPSKTLPLELALPFHATV